MRRSDIYQLSHTLEKFYTHILWLEIKEQSEKLRNTIL